MKLAQLQRAFQSHLLQGADAIAGEIAADERFSSALRLGIYTDAYAARLVEALGETFPAVQAALGTNRFARCVSDFARQQPSRFRSVRAYGEDLPQWLASRLTGPRAAGIADLARFEWAVAGAFDAADDPALGPASLATVAPAQWPALQPGLLPDRAAAQCAQQLRRLVEVCLRRAAPAPPLARRRAPSSGCCGGRTWPCSTGVCP